MTDDTVRQRATSEGGQGEHIPLVRCWSIKISQDVTRCDTVQYLVFSHHTGAGAGVRAIGIRVPAAG